jgi:hypothetical protein
VQAVQRVMAAGARRKFLEPISKLLTGLDQL